MPGSVPPGAAGARRSLRILVADDNEVLRIAIRGLLRNLGHIVEVASNGRDALASAIASDFDFVFLDIQMPVMDGLTAARLMRREFVTRSSPRVIGISGTLEDADLYRSAGIDDFMLKPLRLIDLDRVLTGQI